MKRTYWRKHPFEKLPFLSGIVLIVGITTLLTVIAMHIIHEYYEKPKREAESQRMIQLYRAKAVAEHERQHALEALEALEAETDSHTPETVEDPGIPVETTEVPPTEALQADVIPQDADTNNVRIVISGPYKGLTADEMHEIIEWDRREKALRERRRAFWKKRSAHTYALLAASDRQTALILESWSFLSPELLEAARQVALKTQPADEVDAFFNAIEQNASTRTQEEVDRDFQEYLQSRENHERIVRELAIEWEAIQQEDEELQQPPPTKTSARVHNRSGLVHFPTRADKP